MHRIIVLLCFIFLVSCSGMPEGIEPIKDFKVEKYQGDWYEIARLDHPFERGLEQVSANYTLVRNKKGELTGKLKVINKGYNPEKEKWKKAKGKAKFVGDEDIGHLKVSFFGPFYASYIIFYLDSAYENALVTGPNKKYLWWLSRTPDYDQVTKEKIIALMSKKGYDTDSLIFVEHN